MHQSRQTRLIHPSQWGYHPLTNHNPNMECIEDNRGKYNNFLFVEKGNLHAAYLTMQFIENVIADVINKLISRHAPVYYDHIESRFPCWSIRIYNEHFLAQHNKGGIIGCALYPYFVDIATGALNTDQLNRILRHEIAHFVMLHNGILRCDHHEITEKLGWFGQYADITERPPRAKKEKPPLPYQYSFEYFTE